MNINEIADRAHDHAKKAGFLGDRNIDSMLMDIVDEISEVRQSLKSNKYAFHNAEPGDNIKSKESDWKDIESIEDFEFYIKDSLEDELSDIVLITLSIMKRFDIDIIAHLSAKMKYNELRDDHK